MFSKLLKYELKFVGKWYFALNASIIAISIFLGFSIKTLTDYAENYATSNDNHYTQLIPIILSIMFGVVVASAWIATLAIIVRRFYKNIFGRFYDCALPFRYATVSSAVLKYAVFSALAAPYPMGLFHCR